MTAPSVQVVIVNWQRPEDTLACLESVYQSQGVNFQITLVDNGSQDDSRTQFQAAYPQADLLALPQNLGFAGGYNAGIRRALESEATHLFLLNNDTLIDPGALAYLLQSPWDIAVPKILFASRPDLIWAAGSRWRAFPPAIVMNGYRCPDGPAYDRPQPLEYATGCALLCHRRIFERVAGFDPQFENYMEDYDFMFRARRAGFTAGYVPQARILHKVSQSLGVTSPKRWHYLGRNTVLFYRKEKRFPKATLTAYLTWFTLREGLQGHGRQLPAFWQGVSEGWKALKDLGYD